MPGMGGVQRRKATRHKPGVAVWLSGAGIIGVCVPASCLIAVLVMLGASHSYLTACQIYLYINRRN